MFMQSSYTDYTVVLRVYWTGRIFIEKYVYKPGTGTKTQLRKHVSGLTYHYIYTLRSQVCIFILCKYLLHVTIM